MYNAIVKCWVYFQVRILGYVFSLVYISGTIYCTEPVFLNVYGAQESIPRNEFRQPNVAWRAGTITLFLVPIDCLKIPAQCTVMYTIFLF